MYIKFCINLLKVIRIYIFIFILNKNRKSDEDGLVSSSVRPSICLSLSPSSSNIFFMPFHCFIHLYNILKYSFFCLLLMLLFTGFLYGNLFVFLFISFYFLHFIYSWGFFILHLYEFLIFKTLQTYIENKPTNKSQYYIEDIYELT